MAVSRFRSYGDFNGHRGSGGGGGNFLQNWKKDGEIDVWLSMVALPLGSWRHQIPTLVERMDKETRRKTMRVFGTNYVCWEEEAVLKVQHFYEDKVKGIRQTPPCKCGVCKLAEWTRKQCLLFERTRKKEEHKGIELTTPLFKFEGDVSADTKVITIGGFCNLLGWKDLKPSAKKAIREAGIRLSGPEGAWNQNGLAKLQYGIYVLPAKDPSVGMKLAVETGSLGDKVKEKLNELFDSGIDPSKTPICMRFRYFENEQDLNKKYTATVLRDGERLKVAPPRVLKLLKGEVPEPPDDLVKMFNQKKMRMMLEEHCVLPKGTVPWDKLFPSAEQEKKWEAEAAEAEADDEPEDEDAGESEDGEDEEFACDNEMCGKPVKASDDKCPHCGHVFEVDAAEDEDEEEEPAKPAVKPIAAKAKAKPAVDEKEDEEEEDDDADDESDEDEDEDEEEEDDEDADEEEDEEDEAPAPKKKAAAKKRSSASTGNGGGTRKGVAPGSAVNAAGYPVGSDEIPFCMDMTLSYRSEV